MSVKTGLLLVVLASLVFPLRILMAEPPPTPAGTQIDPWLAAVPRVPELTIPASIGEWKTQRETIRSTLLDCLGKMPARPAKLDVKIISREDKGDYILEKFSFDNGAVATVPGYLLLPKAADPGKKFPAILYCHWHGGQYDIGKDELFKTNAVPNTPGPELVKAGFVVLGIDAYCFGERNGKGPNGPKDVGSAGEMTAAKFNLWVGRSLWGMIVRDDLIALDYLCQRPEVDASRVGVTGASMGATRTWWIMALDERPKTGVAAICMTRYQDLINLQALGAHGIYYFVPGILKHFDTEAIIALAAPRPMLFMSGELDTGSPIEGVHKIESAVRKVYRLYDSQTADDRFKNVVIKDSGHVYTPAMWNDTKAWLKQRLSAEGESE